MEYVKLQLNVSYNNGYAVMINAKIRTCGTQGQSEAVRSEKKVDVPPRGPVILAIWAFSRNHGRAWSLTGQVVCSKTPLAPG